MELQAQLDPSPGVIIQRLDTLAGELQGKALTSGLAGAAKPVKAKMKAIVPRRRGALARSIAHAQLSRSAKARIGVPQDIKAVLVGPIRKVVDPGYHRAPGKKIAQGFKALWLEYGTDPHEIPKKPKTALGKVRKVLSFGGKHYRRVTHPGIKPTRFIARSYQSTQQQVPAGFYKAMSKRLDKLTRANA